MNTPPCLVRFQKMDEKPFRVSVVIPVYNAEKYLERAVKSAAVLDEVGEVVLVDDNGPDQSYLLGKDLAAEIDKVSLYRHHDAGNHGAGASRNLGIQKAKHEFIAFLDADDYYLNNRFVRDSEIFGKDSSKLVDGVYGAIGIEYESERARKKFHDSGFAWQEFLTVSDVVPPDELFDVLSHSHPRYRGEFHTDTITVRRSLFERSGYFEESLRLRQDIHLWRRFAAVGNLVAGSIRAPIAIRGVHENNRMTVRRDHLKYHDLWWESLNEWFCNNSEVSENVKKTFGRLYFSEQIKRGRYWKARWLFLKWVWSEPGKIRIQMGFFDRSFFEVFGQTWITRRIISLKNRLLKAQPLVE